MPSVARTLALDHPLYGMRNLLSTGVTFCDMPAHSRPALNAISIDRSLCRFGPFKKKDWLEAHVLKDSG
jgi:hypothetical protein